MEQRFVVRSVLLTFAVLLLCQPTAQRPLCPSPSDCGKNTLGFGEYHPRSVNSKYLSAIEDPTAMKQLLETLLMQHNEFAEADGFGADEEENATERPSTGLGENQLQKQNITAEQNSTEIPQTENSVEDTYDEDGDSIENTNEENSTERPPIESSLMDMLNQLHSDAGSVDSEELINEQDDEPIWEVTTMQPQQLASPFEIHEYHIETTTERSMESTEVGQVDVKTQTLVNSTNNKNTSSFVVNIPSTKTDRNKKPKRTTTRAPHVTQLDTFPETPSGNRGKFKGKPTTKPDEKINSLILVDRDQDVKGEIQLETLNRPISTRIPLATIDGGSGSATSGVRPNKNPINIIPESIVKKGQKPTSEVGKPQGSGIRNPNRNPVASSSEPDGDDYLISALASFANGEENDGDDDEEDDDEDDDDEEEEKSDEKEEEDDDEYFIDISDEENAQRENFDYIDSGDASDVISSVMEEVSSLL